MNKEKTIIGILGGVAVGAILGVLFATDKGKNTRKKIIKKSATATADLKEKLDALTNTFSEKFNSILNKTEEFTQEEKNRVTVENLKKMNKELGN
jgi:gas vesicle protein